jgi:hypothetical protein
MVHIELKVNDDRLAERLSASMAAVPEFQVVSSEDETAVHDAIFVGLGMAERWGARPLVEQLQVLRTTDADTRRGLPPYVIAGFVLHDPASSPLEVLRIWSRLMAETLYQHPYLQRVGVDTALFDLDRFSAEKIAASLVSGWFAGRQPRAEAR